MYYSKESDPTNEGKVPKQQLEWFERQVAEAQDTKFIICFHVYPGARFKANDLWHPDETRKYFEILRKNQSKVLIEVGAHDHLPALKYHSASGVLNLPDPEVDFLFHNMLIAPSVTPMRGTNPGMAHFEVDDGIVHGLQYEFLDLSTQNE
jgi:hypothetical protein